MDNPEKLATQRRKTKQSNTIRVGHHYAQTNTNIVQEIVILPEKVHWLKRNLKTLRLLYIARLRIIIL